MVGELLDALALEDVVLVGNDTGGAIAQLVATSTPERLGRARADQLRRLRALPAADPEAADRRGEGRGRPTTRRFSRSGPGSDASARLARSPTPTSTTSSPSGSSPRSPTAGSRERPATLHRLAEPARRRSGPASAAAAVHQAGAGRVVRRRRVLPARGRPAAGRRPTQQSTRGDRERENVLDDRPTRPARRADRGHGGRPSRQTGSLRPPRARSGGSH